MAKQEDEDDEVFLAFKERISHDPDQVLTIPIPRHYISLAYLILIKLLCSVCY